MKKYLAIILCLALLTALAVGCAAKPSGTEATPAPVETDAPVSPGQSEPPIEDIDEAGLTAEDFFGDVNAAMATLAPLMQAVSSGSYSYSDCWSEEGEPSIELIWHTLYSMINSQTVTIQGAVTNSDGSITVKEDALTALINECFSYQFSEAPEVYDDSAVVYSQTDGTYTFNRSQGDEIVSERVDIWVFDMDSAYIDYEMALSNDDAAAGLGIASVEVVKNPASRFGYCVEYSAFEGYSDYEPYDDYDAGEFIGMNKADVEGMLGAGAKAQGQATQWIAGEAYTYETVNGLYVYYENGKVTGLKLTQQTSNPMNIWGFGANVDIGTFEELTQMYGSTVMNDGDTYYIEIEDVFNFRWESASPELTDAVLYAKALG